MPGCSAVGCNNRSEKGYAMKCFPHNPKLRKIWCDRVSRANWEPSKNSFLCHVHFETNQWIITRSGKIKLKKNAVPSLFAVATTRNLLRKSRKLFDDDNKDRRFIKYHEILWKSKLLPILSDESREQNYRCDNVETIIGWPVYANSIGPPAARIAMMRNHSKRDTMVISIESGAANARETEPKYVTESKIMEETMEIAEMNSQANANHELDDIEEKLRSICDGEPQYDYKTPTDRADDKIKRENFQQCHDEHEKYSSKLLNFGNNETLSANRSNDNVSYRDDKKSAIPNETNVPSDGATNSKERVVDSCEKMPEALKRSTFTIKLTGNDEDVTDIVESLGTEPILKYKSSNDASNGNWNIVTSVISVTDAFFKKSEKSDGIERRSRHEKRDSNIECTNDIAPSLITNGNERKFNEFTKLRSKSPEDYRNTIDCANLRKKIKFQAEIINNLKKQLKVNKESAIMFNPIGTRSKTRRQKFMQKACNGDCQYGNNKDKNLSDLSAKIKDADEIIERLKKSLGDERQNMKNSQSQIRQRDNHIKELNWKLNKASKYIERAERNANNYRKKMLSLQSMLKRYHNPKIKDESTFLTDEAKIVTEQSSMSLMEITRMNNYKNEEEIIASNERTRYQTVQDIFDESNRCDDGPIIIHSLEEFMRRFAGSL